LKKEKNMEETGKEEPGSKMGLFAGIAIGLLLLVIGSGTGNNGVIHAGAFILSLASFWGGFYLPKENVAIKTALLAIGGLVAIAAFLGVSSLMG
jgi:hypothetical protein